MRKTSQAITNLLLDWKAGFLFMLVGIALGSVAYFVFPGDHQAMATVIVDMNVEQNWAGSPDNEIFYFLDRETRKLEEFAWSDQVLTEVGKASGLSVSELRNDVLSLSQPKDGGWHFFARSKDQITAEKAASTWAVAFADGVNTQITGNNTAGLLENISVSASRIEDLPSERTSSLGIDALVGSLGGWLFGLLVTLFRKK